MQLNNITLLLSVITIEKKCIVLDLLNMVAGQTFWSKKQGILFLLIVFTTKRGRGNFYKNNSNIEDSYQKKRILIW